MTGREAVRRLELALAAVVATAVLLMLVVSVDAIRFHLPALARRRACSARRAHVRAADAAGGAGRGRLARRPGRWPARPPHSGACGDSGCSRGCRSGRTAWRSSAGATRARSAPACCARASASACRRSRGSPRTSCARSSSTRRATCAAATRCGSPSRRSPPTASASSPRCGGWRHGRWRSPTSPPTPPQSRRWARPARSPPRWSGCPIPRPSASTSCSAARCRCRTGGLAACALTALGALGGSRSRSCSSRRTRRSPLALLPALAVPALVPLRS